MFENIGKKIKGLAKIACWVAIVLVVIAGFVEMAESGFLTGLVGIVVGVFAAWIGSFALYGFGELIDKTSEIAENTKK